MYLKLQSYTGTHYVMYIHECTEVHSMYVWYPGVYTHVLNNRILKIKDQRKFIIYLYLRVPVLLLLLPHWYLYLSLDM